MRRKWFTLDFAVWGNVILEKIKLDRSLMDRGYSLNNNSLMDRHVLF